MAKVSRVAHEMDWTSGAIKIELLDPSGQVIKVDMSTRITFPPEERKESSYKEVPIQV
jgi:hypothetical protein